MCVPDGKFNMTLKAKTKCDLGHAHEVSEIIMTSNYQEAAKRVKRFWEPINMLKFVQGNTPEVKAGGMDTFIIVSRNKEGRDFCYPAYYLNAYPLNYEEDCADRGCPKDANHEDGCPTTGWFYDESNFEYDNCYHSIAAEVLAWAPLPKAADVLASLQPQT